MERGIALRFWPGRARIEWDGHEAECGGPVEEALPCSRTGVAVVLLKADTCEERLELYGSDGKRVRSWAAPQGFDFYTLQEAPSQTPQFTVVCVPHDMNEQDWQFKIDVKRKRLERYSPWR